MNSLEKLQELLRDLFQLDLADLDFGMYRLLHLKRHELETFLNDQLPRRVREAFQSMAGQESTDLEKNLSELQDKLRDNLGEDALMDNGEMNWHSTNGHLEKHDKLRQLLEVTYDGTKENELYPAV